jgi:hypothetical protein
VDFSWRTSQEIGKIYQAHLKDQVEKMNEQFRELE